MFGKGQMVIMQSKKGYYKITVISSVSEQKNLKMINGTNYQEKNIF